MKSTIGETLRQAREQKDCSIEQMAMEINISKEYLHALESERFDIFPAEAYLLGFLRNYAEALGLNEATVIEQYRRYKISEEPTPITELVGPAKGKGIPRPLIITALSLIAVGLVAWGVFSFFFNSSNRVKVAEAPVIETRETILHTLEEGQALWDITHEDAILIPSETADIKMTALIENNQLRLQPVNDDIAAVTLNIGDSTVMAPLSGSPILTMHLQGLEGDTASLFIEREDLASDLEDDSALPEGLAIIEQDKSLILSNVEEKSAFTLNGVFTSYALFRYKLDDQEPIEAFYSEKDQIRINAESSMMIWLSNSGSLSLKVAGESVNPGKAGEVTVKLIQWVKNDEGKYDLVLFPVQ